MQLVTKFSFMALFRLLKHYTEMFALRHTARDLLLSRIRRRVKSTWIILKNHVAPFSKHTPFR